MLSVEDYIPAELFEIIQSSSLLKDKPTFLVGGAVRDALRGKGSMDFDIEVHETTLGNLSQTLAPLGKTCSVGKSFGVVKLFTKAGNSYDFSLPRADKKTGPGHRGFQIQFDPNLSPKEAASRRDFTINALMYDLKARKLLDFFGGRDDLEHGILRHVSDAFAEDPLRVLRGMQFASRFNLTPAPETIAFSRSIASTYKELPFERVREEWMKWATLAMTPSLGILFLEASGWLEHFPELVRLRTCPQDPVWHPEGDVLTHTLMACDALAAQEGWFALPKDVRSTLMIGTLCHDMGKPDTLSREIINGIERIHAYDHATVGLPKVESFMTRIGMTKNLQKHVLTLVANHSLDMNPASITTKAIRRLAVRLEPETIENLTRLIAADSHGRDSTDALQLLKQTAHNLKVTNTSPRPLLSGNQIIRHSKLGTGRRIGFIKQAAYEAQLAGQFNNLDSALVWLRDYLAKHEDTKHEKT